MTTTWTNLAKNIIGFLLKQDGGFLLTQDGFKIVLTNGTSWSNQTKH